MTVRYDVVAVRRALADPARVTLLLSLGEGARRQNGGVLVRCPWHPDRSPSCSLTRGPDGTLRAKCFACGAGADVLGLVAAVRGLDASRDFRRVLAAAADLVGVQPDESHEAPPASPTDRRPGEPCPLEPDRFAEIVAPLLVVGRLDEHPLSAPVRSYLDGRGLLAEARADGWAALGDLDAQSALVRMLCDVFGSDVEPTRLVRRGAFTWPEHALVIPWRDAAGRVATLQRRALGEIGRNAPKYVFPMGRAPTEPYGVDRLSAASADAPIVFVEGAVDVLALRALNRAHGVDRVVVGVPGASSWRAEWAALAHGRAAVIAFDADRAGNDAAPRIAADLMAAGAHTIQRSRPRHAKDWAEQFAAGCVREAA